MLSNLIQPISTRILYPVLFSKYLKTYIFFEELNCVCIYFIIFLIFRYISHLCYCSNNTEIVSGCLEALDAIMCYSNLQSDSLQTFIIALCRSVNVETYCQTSWKVNTSKICLGMKSFKYLKIQYKYSTNIQVTQETYKKIAFRI